MNERLGPDRRLGLRVGDALRLRKLALPLRRPLRLLATSQLIEASLMPDQDRLGHYRLLGFFCLGKRTALLVMNRVDAVEKLSLIDDQPEHLPER